MSHLLQRGDLVAVTPFAHLDRIDVFHEHTVYGVALEGESVSPRWHAEDCVIELADGTTTRPSLVGRLDACSWIDLGGNVPPALEARHEALLDERYADDDEEWAMAHGF